VRMKSGEIVYLVKSIGHDESSKDMEKFEND